jgi:charged multivesicular body protein 7
MVRIMEMSSQTLGSLNKQTGGVDRVQDVMEELRSQMMDVDDVTAVINEESAGKIDEGEVEDELEAMEKIELEKVEATERKAREAKEAREAEETKRRLAELDTPGEKQEETASRSAEPAPVREKEAEAAS